MKTSEIIILAVLAFIIFGFYHYFPKNKLAIPPLVQQLDSENQAGSGADVTIQSNTGGQVASLANALPVADYISGPQFYLANQPWYFDPTLGGVMPMNAGSANITGAPSAQTRQ